MRRFVAVVTIVVLVLAMSAGPAFAYSCSSDACCTRSRCAPMATPACGPSVITVCPMAGGGQVARNAGCMRHDERPPLGSASIQAGRDSAAVSLSAFPVPSVSVLQLLPHDVFAPDARGAPHLTTVIRI